jgi:glyoxylase-like metal-dependent hydrolase (beta-lactamase superfamily II)
VTEPVRGHRVGAFTVTKIPECELPFAPPSRLFPDFDATALAGHEAAVAPSDPASAATVLTISVHSWLLRAPGVTILVDTGIGNGKPRRVPTFDRLDTPYLDRLAAAGVAPEAVDYVLLTHVHTDHVGWNTRMIDGRWAPTFPNATTVLPQAGYHYFQSGAGRAAPNRDMFLDSVVPVVEAGRARLIGPEGGAVLPGLTYLPTPGHSIDHMSIILRSESAVGVFAGDVMHHPAQVFVPSWNSCFCADAEEARRSRRCILDLCASEDATYFSTHFADASAGRISLARRGFAWTFEG